MPPLSLLLVSLATVVSLVLGAAAAVRVRLPARVASSITAYGGGILLAAVALELLPAADQGAGPALTAVGILAGAGAYLGVEELLTATQSEGTRRAGHAAAVGMPMSMPVPGARGAPDPESARRGRTIAAGIVIDGIPESLALGLAVAAADGSMASGGAALVAAIVLGNLTEAYGAAQPLLAGGLTVRPLLVLFSVIAVLLGLVTVLGGTVLATTPAPVIGTAQAFAAGAVVAVLSTAVIPYAFRQVSSGVAVAVVLGLVTGYLLG